MMASGPRPLPSPLLTAAWCYGGGAPPPPPPPRHTSRFMICWHALLPIALVPTLGWATVPVAAFVSYFMMGVEDIGVTIEEPYKQLALDATCAGLNANTSTTYAEDMVTASSIVDKVSLESSANTNGYSPANAY
mmetsp:Transcript_3523/g.8775  ORF Transcript_3523/g.8775 Transcript_3523/m.8775 type:complete len:134 (-) Transcript_3523:284-685(-)